MAEKVWHEEARGALTAREAAALYDLNYKSLLQHVRRGSVVSYKMPNGKIMIYASDARALVTRLAKRRKNAASRRNKNKD